MTLASGTERAVLASRLAINGWATRSTVGIAQAMVDICSVRIHPRASDVATPKAFPKELRDEVVAGAPRSFRDPRALGPPA